MMVRLDFRAARAGGARLARADAAARRASRSSPKRGPHLPFSDGSVDEMFIGRATVAYRADIAATLDELWRVSKPGALIHLTLPHASSMHRCVRAIRAPADVHAEHVQLL